MCLASVPRSSSGTCTADTACANETAAAIVGLIGMYAKRGFGAPERRMPATLSIACTRPRGSPVKSIESLHSTESPNRPARLAWASHGPSSGSSRANAGAVARLIEIV